MTKIFSKENEGAWTLGILCFQGFGLRIFEGVLEGAIALWLIVLCILNINFIKKTPLKYWMKVFTIVLLYFIFCYIKEVDYVPFLIVAWLSSAVVLTRYRVKTQNFIDDMRKLTRFCMYYSLLHIPVMLIFNSMIITTNFNMTPKTFLYLFWFNVEEGIFGINRIQGFCWEPSCWNLLLDFNLVFSLFYKEKFSTIILSILAIISITSTTGIVVMGIILCSYFILSLNKKNLIKSILTFSILYVVLAPFIYNELQDKVNSTSGSTRVGDFAIAAAIIKESPLLGADLDNITKNIHAIKARQEIWGIQGGDFEGYMENNMVNSFAALFVEWGFPITLIIFIAMYNTPLVENKKLRFLLLITLLSVLMGTPIARTGFFYLFSFSTLLIHKELYFKTKIRSENPSNSDELQNINNNCNL